MARYLNWDIPEDRDRLLSRTFPEAKLWVFDELHKFRGWRAYLKGLYDKTRGEPPILVTGSARLHWYRYGGDSLQGRYHYLRLRPFSVRELGGAPGALRELFEKGGFPERLLKLDARGARRWSLEYRARLLRDDLQGVENLPDLGRLEILMASLPDRVGSPLSVNALREDLQISHPTVARWLDVFERVYAIYRVPPFGAPKLRAVKREQKHYHFDWSLVREPGPRFENLVGSHLLKWVHFQVDVEGRDLRLSASSAEDPSTEGCATSSRDFPRWMAGRFHWRGPHTCERRRAFTSPLQRNFCRGSYRALLHSPTYALRTAWTISSGVRATRQARARPLGREPFALR